MIDSSTRPRWIPRTCCFAALGSFFTGVTLVNAGVDGAMLDVAGWLIEVGVYLGLASVVLFALSWRQRTTRCA